jgi:hypothetical protein
LVKEAMVHGPQEISLRGEPVVIVISKNQYLQLLKPTPSFIDFMRSSPLIGVSLQIERNASSTRDVDL